VEKNHKGETVMLKALVLRQKIKVAEEALDKLRGEKTELDKREAEIAASIDELDANATEETRSAIENTVDEHTAAATDLKKRTEDKTAELEKLRSELAEIEAAQNTTPPAGAGATARRENVMIMTRMTKEVFKTRTAQEVNEIMCREEVKDFVHKVRGLKGLDIRAVSGVDIVIPESIMPLVAENITERSVLLGIVNDTTLSGDGVQPITEAAKEAIWTANCGRLNQLNLAIFSETYSSNKLGAYFALCNAAMQDADIDLLAIVIRTLAGAIAYSIDKAILYGDGRNKPVGIITRLAQTAKPDNYSANARPWKDLTDHIVTINSPYGTSGLQELLLAAAKMSNPYAKGDRSWVMTDKALLAFKAGLITTNLNGLIVAGLENEMPVIGGKIVIVPDGVLPDNVIVGGFFDCYTFATRRTMEVSASDQVLFLSDETAVKATGRYDGKPTIADAFVVIGLGAAPATSVVFPEDEANQLVSVIAPASVTIKVGESKQVKTVPVPFGINAKLTYRIDNPLCATVDSNGVVTALPDGAVNGTTLYIYDGTKYPMPAAGDMFLAMTAINIPAVESGSGSDDDTGNDTDNGADNGNG
jgi:HK97 family phage major capsid protein